MYVAEKSNDLCITTEGLASQRHLITGIKNI